MAIIRIELITISVERLHFCHGRPAMASIEHTQAHVASLPTNKMYAINASIQMEQLSLCHS